MPALSSAALRKTEFQKILLIKLSALGDLVHSIPVVSKLRRLWGAPRIHGELLSLSETSSG